MNTASIYSVMNRFVTLIAVLLYSLSLAQIDTLQLVEVLISDVISHRYQSTTSSITLSDSVLENASGSFTQLLNQNSLIYFKENGLGMTSSPSFRGTTASQTAVVWNGLNINSQLVGQTDFNTISPYGMDEVEITAGGRSVAYGTSAIGGTIQLKQNLDFKPKFLNRIRLDYGSFNTVLGQYSSNYANDNFNLKLSYTRIQSDNDFDYPKNKGKNLNGHFYNNNIDLALGYKINQKHYLKLFSNIYDGERELSIILPTENKTKYHDYNTRSLAQWDAFLGRFISILKFAYLAEEYRYYSDIHLPDYTSGETTNLISKYDLNYRINASTSVNLILDYAHQKGKGSGIQDVKRDIGSFSLWFKQNLNRLFSYELSLRQDVGSDYDNPLLYSAGIAVQPTLFYKIRLNTSKSFRIPTYNDLYWEGSGNLDLKPESSVQYEIGNDLKWKGFSITINAYYNYIKDMIRWVPSASGLWIPVNADKATIYGLEALSSWDKTLGKHHIKINANYGYTVSKDNNLKKQFTYVPYHKGNASLAYQYKRIGFNYQWLFVGDVYTRSDNNPKYKIERYTVSNLGFNYKLGEKYNYEIGFRILNLYDKTYQSIEDRYLPGRNYNAYINLKF